MIFPTAPKSCEITKVEREGRTVYLTSEKGLLRICLYEEALIRVSFSPEKCFNEEQGKEFLPPVKTLDFTLEENTEDPDTAGKYVVIKTSSIICKIAKKTGALSFYKCNESLPLFSEADKGHLLEKFDLYKNIGKIKTEEIQTADGVKKRIVAADKIFDKSLYHTRLDFTLDEDEKIFGLGQAEEGEWNLRNTTQYLNQANKKIAIPFFVSSKGYGILFSSQSPCIFNDTKEG
ncbi:MAG: DUF4968 domain-containing protein, partial [Treponema sp.]|nr:DUF4968 domain-containing protein [Treponema sp.]